MDEQERNSKSLKRIQQHLERESKLREVLVEQVMAPDRQFTAHACKESTLGTREFDTSLRFLC